MRKIIIASLIIILIVGGVINAKSDGHLSDDIPPPEAYFQCTDCLQIILIIMFLLISGFSLIFDPEPLAKWLEKSKRGSGSSIFILRLLGILQLAMILLTSYEITTNCQTFCGLFPK